MQKSIKIYSFEYSPFSEFHKYISTLRSFVYMYEHLLPYAWDQHLHNIKIWIPCAHIRRNTSLLTYVQLFLRIQCTFKEKPKKPIFWNILRMRYVPSYEEHHLMYYSKSLETKSYKFQIKCVSIFLFIQLGPLF